MMFSKQRLTLLLALLFAVGMSAEPIIHAHELDDDHHHEHVECQVCEVETLKFNDLALLEKSDETVVSKTTVEPQVLSTSANGFSARAPPILNLKNNF